MNELKNVVHKLITLGGSELYITNGYIDLNKILNKSVKNRIIPGLIFEEIDKVVEK